MVKKGRQSCRHIQSICSVLGFNKHPEDKSNYKYRSLEYKYTAINLLWLIFSKLYSKSFDQL